MKSIKRICKTPITLTMFLIASACSDSFLDVQDPNNITSTTFWSSPEDVQLAINTLYAGEGNGLNSIWDGASEPSNLRGDDVVLTTADFANFNQFATFVNTPVNGVSDGIWDGSFNLIFGANTILKQIETENNIPFDDETLRAIYIAETKFFRGAAYFRLAHTYGQVPIVLEPAETQDQFDNPKSATFEAVWDQAITDLQAAKDGLPDEQEDIGRVNKAVATAFLGQLYLYRAGYLNDDSFYSRAANEFKEIIDMGKYSLVENWVDNLLAATENNAESIYEAQYDIFTGSYAATQPRAFNGSLPGVAGEIVFRPSAWLFEEMSRERTQGGELDPRLLNTIYFQGGYTLFGVPFEELGDGLVCQSGGSFTLDGAGIPAEFDGWFRKYLNVDLDCENPDAAVNNERIMRYSDVLLMYAEALVMSGGDLAVAADAVNEIRARANLVAMTFANGDELMAEIEHQRIMEFAFEGKRYYDLIRWGKLREALEAHGFESDASNIDEEKHKYFPIPLQEVNANALLEQNPLWQ